MGIVPILEFQNLKKSGHSDFPGKKKTIWNWIIKDWPSIGLFLTFLLFCAIHVVLETIKQHLRILMLRQYSTGNIFKN